MQPTRLSLYTYWRSSAAYRVRIALNLKQLEYESKPVHLVRDGGEQHGAQFRPVNPQALMATDSGSVPSRNRPSLSKDIWATMAPS